MLIAVFYYEGQRTEKSNMDNVKLHYKEQKKLTKDGQYHVALIRPDTTSIKHR